MLREDELNGKLVTFEQPLWLIKGSEQYAVGTVRNPNTMKGIVEPIAAAGSRSSIARSSRYWRAEQRRWAIRCACPCDRRRCVAVDTVAKNVEDAVVAIELQLRRRNQPSAWLAWRASTGAGPEEPPVQHPQRSTE